MRPRSRSRSNSAATGKKPSSEKNRLFSRRFLNDAEGATDGFIDDKLQSALESSSDAHHDEVINFFRIFALCHTVRSELNNVTGVREYKAESPDEKALVDAARDAGVEFVDTVAGICTILVKGVPERSASPSARRRLAVCRTAAALP